MLIEYAYSATRHAVGPSAIEPPSDSLISFGFGDETYGFEHEVTEEDYRDYYGEDPDPDLDLDGQASDDDGFSGYLSDKYADEAEKELESSLG